MFTYTLTKSLLWMLNVRHMLKRILVDFTLFKQVHPNLKCVLIQVESQLCGDYSSPSKDIILGSHS